MLPFLMFHAASTDAASTPTTPVKVFLLIGQSNMEGHGLVNVSAGAGVGNGTLQYAVEHHPSAGFPTCNITEAAARREGCNAAGADLDVDSCARLLVVERVAPPPADGTCTPPRA